jgi:hypothetical protein
LLDGLTSIISQLEKQKGAIERALAALREVDGGALVAPTTPTAKSKATNKRSLAQKARWAGKKAAPVQATEGGMNEISKKPGMTDAGRKRLSEAMKKRWAVKRAGSAAKKRAGRPKKSA